MSSADIARAPYDSDDPDGKHRFLFFFVLTDFFF